MEKTDTEDEKYSRIHCGNNYKSLNVVKSHWIFGESTMWYKSYISIKLFFKVAVEKENDISVRGLRDDIGEMIRLWIFL